MAGEALKLQLKEKWGLRWTIFNTPACNSGEVQILTMKYPQEKGDAVLRGRRLLSRILRELYAFFICCHGKFVWENLSQAVGTKGHRWDLSRSEIFQSL